MCIQCVLEAALDYCLWKLYCGKRRKSLFNIQCHLQNRLCSLHFIRDVGWFGLFLFVRLFLYATAQLTLVARECIRSF